MSVFNGDLVKDTPVGRAVLELTSVLHNWRQDPSPENFAEVAIAAWHVSGYALELEAKVQALVTGDVRHHG